jgi:hypothetical protein
VVAGQAEREEDGGGGVNRWGRRPRLRRTPWSGVPNTPNDADEGVGSRRGRLPHT